MVTKSIAGMALGVVLVAAAQSPAVAQAETKLAVGLSWVNEDGTVLAITAVGANGQLTGTVTTQSGCGAKKAQPMTGWYYGAGAGGALAFTANWEGCNSVTSWTAQYSNATGAFRALWHLAIASGPVWNGIVAGAHTFVPLPAKKP
ncbi:MAG TPA: avidin/streptavidin family protein [Pseudolabrys sp.]|nr:avidin/streptavidin family protein [Pseudolabrys sp.]